MNFGIATYGFRPEHIVPLARHAEAVGFDGIWQPPVFLSKFVGPATPTSPVATKIVWPCAAQRCSGLVTPSVMH